MAYEQAIWDSIKREWLAGQLSVSDISRTYGPSRGGILRRAKVEDWPSRGTLVEEVRKEIDTQLLAGDENKSDSKSDSQSGTPETDDIIAHAAMRGAEVIRFHRGLLGHLLRHAKVTLEELDNLELIRIEIIAKAKLKQRERLVSALIKNRIEGMKAVSQVLNQALPLDRQAFSLDTDRGGVAKITYNTPKINKPPGSGLSEDEWEEKE